MSCAVRPSGTRKSVEGHGSGMIRAPWLRPAGRAVRDGAVTLFVVLTIAAVIVEWLGG